MVLPNAHGALRVDDECDRRKSWTCWARTFTLCAGSMRPYPPPRWPQWAAGTRLRQIEPGPPLRRHPTCARLTRRYAAALSRPCDVIASLPVTSSNGPDPWVFVRELALQGVSKPMRTILDLHAGVVVTHNLIRTSSD